MSGRTVIAVQLPRGMFFGEHWAAKCSTCGAWLSKYDFTREGALASAADQPCKCGRVSR